LLRTAGKANLLRFFSFRKIQGIQRLCLCLCWSGLTAGTFGGEKCVFQVNLGKD
jgi:hypothetical protein